MEHVKSELYGYKIGKNLLYHVSGSVILNIDNVQHRDRSQRVCIRLRKTMAVLLEYLLSHAEKGLISDTELISKIWEENGLKGSSARLWQVMSALKKKIDDAGCEQDIIFRVNGEGYMLRETLISPLYQSSEPHGLQMLYKKYDAE